MKLASRIAIASFATTLSMVSASQAVVFTGSLTQGDPTFNRPSSSVDLSGIGTAAAFDTFTFIAADSGPYSVAGAYTGGLDGYLFLYSPSFNPLAPLTNLQAADDDFTAVTDSLIPSSDSFGPQTTDLTLTLTPGASYTLVVTAFSNANISDGLGDYSVTVIGDVIPEPTVLGLLAGASIMALRRRRA